MKIDIFVKKFGGSYVYQCSTTRSKTCKDAKNVFLQMNTNFNKDDVKAFKEIKN